ncbi:hypothetical protein ACFVVX_11265 [Kitasatospora sp. NPDC058170]|uniref:hypothetical protein n=1 Tax=Kitasatospora sp. NPDC058170 TaxID=3346364 RepID=UPI0036DBD91F
MSDDVIVHRLVDAFFTHCHHCDQPRDPECHPRSHWRLYLDLDHDTLQHIRQWALDPDSHPATPAERALLLHWLDTQGA